VTTEAALAACAAEWLPALDAQLGQPALAASKPPSRGAAAAADALLVLTRSTAAAVTDRVAHLGSVDAAEGWLDRHSVLLPPEALPGPPRDLMSPTEKEARRMKLGVQSPAEKEGRPAEQGKGSRAVAAEGLSPAESVRRRTEQGACVRDAAAVALLGAAAQLGRLLQHLGSWRAASAADDAGACHMQAAEDMSALPHQCGAAAPCMRGHVASTPDICVLRQL